MSKSRNTKLAPTNYTTAREWSDAEKLARGCENPDCGMRTDYVFVPRQLEWAHVIPGTAYLDRNGRRIHPSDMVKNGASAWNARYGMATILAEIAKCRVLCACCHALESSEG